jgi:cytochrome c biogenesis protein
VTTTREPPTVPLDVDPPRGPRPSRARFGLLTRAWRQLTSMRTALLLLFLLALAAVPGSLLPQRGVTPLRVEQYYAEHPRLAPLLDRLSLFDVFAAPWFAAVYVLLFVSLVGCLAGRVRLPARALRCPPPPAPAHPARLRHGTAYATDAPPEQVLAAAAAGLRRRRYRVAGTPDTVCAEKGYLRETGNLVFHLALVALLAGVAAGSLFGYSGTVLLVEGGRGFTNSLISYDQFTAGPRVDPARLRPFSVRLEDFAARYQPDGTPRDFAARVRYRPDLDAGDRSRTIAVNRPLAIGPAKTYLIGHGYAPRFTVRDRAGRVVFSDHVPCTPQDAAFASTCTVKVSDTTPQLGFQAVFFPTTRLDPAQGYVSVHPALTAPGMTIAAWSGRLGVDSGIPQSVYELDTRRLSQARFDGPVGPDRPAQLLDLRDPAKRGVTGLPGGHTLTVDDVREFATFQVKKDPARLLVLVAAAVSLAGLVASLRVRRRRMWVRVVPAAGRTLVEVGGLSRSESDERAAGEFAAVVAGLPARRSEEG